MTTIDLGAYEGVIESYSVTLDAEKLLSALVAEIDNENSDRSASTVASALLDGIVGLDPTDQIEFLEVLISDLVEALSDLEGDAE